MDGMYSVNAGAINGLCGPDKLQKKSIARSVPKAEGAGCPFAYFSDKGKVRLADASRGELFLILKKGAKPSLTPFKNDH
ncbi:hypothetical protein [Marinobacterium sp. LSUCC0821]|uniref:hypothetical protein n=1 Tax=Marinobacterium sp. LSUCC0821 TaxID=2668067 RepID=UPI00145281EF|nr:hypothetical protein [Marinobacterium sp. LSUCC0821]QJD70914.1 hypothetical protein HH196_04050 [Marinobacterium sp. LSUCC0821]